MTRDTEARFRLTVEERSTVDRAVEILGVPLASYLRQLTLRDARQVIAEAKAAEEGR